MGLWPDVVMQIGNLTIEPPVFLAPMAGYTDMAFRLPAREHGCGLVFSEMVSAKGLQLKQGRTSAYLRNDPEEFPLAVQLFGTEPEVLAQGAMKAREAGAAVIDLNMGCPVRKVTKKGAGAALMKTPELIQRILDRVRRAVDCPLTVKIRLGWDSSTINHLEVGRIAQDCGVDAVTLHGRTAKSLFTGQADWDAVRALKEHLDIPVVGNGDVTRPEQVLEMMAHTGCDAVMVGRASMGNPWFFQRAAALLEGRPDFEPDLDERERMIRRHFELLLRLYQPIKAVRKLRTHIMHYTRGLPYGSTFRGKIQRVDDEKVLFSELSAYFEAVKEHGSEEDPPERDSGDLLRCVSA